MSPREEHESISYWQGKVDGELESQGALIRGLQKSMDRVETKVNALKNDESRRSGGDRVQGVIGGLVASGVLLVFGAFVTKAFG